MQVHFVVPGKPATAGSHKAFGLRSRKTGKYKAVVRPDCDDLAAWQAIVKSAAIQAMEGRPPTDEQVILITAFNFARPKSHWGLGRNGATLKKTAPEFHTVKPDLSKLIRAVEDALTGVVWLDDNQVVRHDSVKQWHGDHSFVVIRVVESYDVLEASGRD